MNVPVNFAATLTFGGVLRLEKMVITDSPCGTSNAF